MAVLVSLLLLLITGLGLTAWLQVGTVWPGHEAFALTGLAFIVGDVLWLRILATLSNLMIIHFSTWHPSGEVQRVPLYWNALYAAINTVRIALILRDRQIWLSEAELRVYNEHFQPVMEKADFQRLLRRASLVSSTERHVLYTLGVPVTELVLIVVRCARPLLTPPHARKAIEHTIRAATRAWHPHHA